MPKIISNKSVYEDKFVQVLLEDVELDDGKLITDFSIVKKRDIVMAVCRDIQGKYLLIREYKYGTQKYMWTLPAGGLKKNEKPEDAAKREVEEETGYSGKEYKMLGVVYDYPSKDRHSVYVVFAPNIQRLHAQTLDDTEQINSKFVDLAELVSMISDNSFQVSSAMAALLLSFQTK